MLNQANRVADISLHMTISLSRAATWSFRRYISRPTAAFVSPTHFSSPTSFRKMSFDDSKNKTEEEWRAILTPEQVRTSLYGVIAFFSPVALR
jgi:hypothetical protein